MYSSADVLCKVSKRTVVIARVCVVISYACYNGDFFFVGFSDNRCPSFGE